MTIDLKAYATDLARQAAGQDETFYKDMYRSERQLRMIYEKKCSEYEMLIDQVFERKSMLWDDLQAEKIQWKGKNL